MPDPDGLCARAPRPRRACPRVAVWPLRATRRARLPERRPRARPGLRSVLEKWVFPEYAGGAHEVVYRDSDLCDAADVNKSWENLGYATLKPDLRDSLLSYPWTLVTPKVR